MRKARRLVVANLWTADALDRPPRARSFLQRLQRAGAPFAPARFGHAESARTPFAMAPAVKMLCSDGRFASGSIFVAGSKHGFLAFIQWSRPKGISRWYFEIGGEYLDAPAHRDAFEALLAVIAVEHGAVHGGIAPAEEWQAKHRLIEVDQDGDEAHSMVGLEAGAFLPGIYGTTIFAAPTVKALGRDRIAQRAVHRADLPGGGMVARFRDQLTAQPLAARLAQDAAVVKALGKDYFFDIARRRPRYRAIAGLTKAPNGATSPRSGR